MGLDKRIKELTLLETSQNEDRIIVDDVSEPDSSRTKQQTKQNFLKEIVAKFNLYYTKLEIDDFDFLVEEVDPIFVASPAHGIASQDITNWNTAYGWGNHAGLYDPIGSASSSIASHLSSFNHNLIATAIQSSEKGSNNGVASLDAGGKVPVNQLPSTVMEFKGNWNATTNIPHLEDGTGNAGDVYLVSIAGTHDFGSGNISFALGDWVIYNGSIWQKSINSNDVVSVNGQQGVVVLNTSHISENTNLYFTNQRAIDAVANSYFKLNQTTPQTLSGGDFSGSGLIKITNGLLGVDTTSYAPVSSLADYWKRDGSSLASGNWNLRQYNLTLEEGAIFVGSPITLDDLTGNISISQNFTSGSIYDYESIGNFSVRAYGYKIIDGEKIFTSNYIEQTIQTDGSGNPFYFDVSITDTGDYDGFKVSFADDFYGGLYIGYNYLEYVKTGNITSFTFDNPQFYEVINESPLIVTPLIHYRTVISAYGNIEIDNNLNVGNTITTNSISAQSISSVNGLISNRLGIGDVTSPTARLDVRDEGNIALYVKRTGVFDFVRYFRSVGSVWTDITTLAGTTKTSVSGDILDAVNDFCAFGKTTQFSSVYIDISKAISSGGTLVWEYSMGGDTWGVLSVSDGTVNLTVDGAVNFTPPSDWATDSQNNSQQMYFVRVRVSAGTFTTEPTIYLAVPNNGADRMVQIYANGRDTAPSFSIDRQGNLILGVTSSAITLTGSVSTSSSVTVATTLTASGTITQSLLSSSFAISLSPTVGFRGALSTSAPSTALIPVQFSPTLSLQAESWSGSASKTNEMDIVVKPTSALQTMGRMVFKNRTVDDIANNAELMSLTSDGELNVIGRAQRSTDVFDYVQHFVGGVYTNDTALVSYFGSITADVLDIVGNYLYIGKIDTYNSVYFDFATIMSAGTNRTWEYWNGSTWVTLTVTDGTNNWQNAGSITFTPPVNWAVGTVNSVANLYWIRVGTASGTFTVEPVLRWVLPSSGKTTLIDREILSNTEFDTSSKWNVTGDWAYTTGDYTFTRSTGAGTLYQLKSDFNYPLKPNAWYRFRFVVGVAGPTGTLAWIGKEVAEENTYFTTSTTEVDVYFKTNSDPQDFVIYTTASTTSGFRLDGVSLTEMTDGNVSITGKFMSGNKAVKLVDEYFAEMWEYTNTNPTTIGTINVYHAVDDFVAGKLNGFTFVAGIEGSFTSVSDYSGTVAGTILITDTAHGLLTGDIITIHSTTNYNGTYSITKVTDDTFYVTATYVSTETGEWAMGSYLLCSVGSDGTYRANFNLTATTTNPNESLKFELFKNTGSLDNVSNNDEFTNTKYSTIGGSGLVDLVAGDRIWLAVENQSSGADVIVRHANVNLNRV